MSTPIFTDLEKINALYHAINVLMGEMGANGEVHTQMECSSKVMNALYDIDGGVYLPEKDLFTTNTLSVQLT